MVIKALQSQNPHSDERPEAVNVVGTGLLDQAKKTLHNWWYSDTITPISNIPLPAIEPVAIDLQAKSVSFVPSTKSISENISWLWNLLWRQPAASNRSDAITLSPEQVDDTTRKMFADAMIEMQQKVQELDEEYQQLLKENPAKAESVIFKVLALLVKNQLKIREEQTLFTSRRVTNNQNNLKQINEQHAKISEEQETLSKRENRARIVAKVIGGAAGIAALATLAIATGGTSLAATFGIANMAATTTTIATYATAGLNVAAGATLVLKEYLSGKVDAATKKSIILQVKQELESEGITSDINEVKASIKDIATYWTMLKEVAERHNEASTFMNRR